MAASTAPASRVPATRAHATTEHATIASPTLEPSASGRTASAGHAGAIGPLTPGEKAWLSELHQSPVGLGMALSVLGAWAAWLGYHLRQPWSGIELWQLPVGVLVQCFLFTGIFITAHDAMHGTVAPRHPRLNAWIGRSCTRLFAALSYDRLRAAHLRHHRSPGTPEDPDFFADRPAFGHWLWTFMTRYLTLGQVVGVVGLASGWLLLGADWQNILIFWALPMVLSTLQLFVFGTYLPHRPPPGGFDNPHRARTLAYGWGVSLLTCYHFGYHLEHHAAPAVPWWALPRFRAGRVRALPTLTTAAPLAPTGLQP